MKTKTKTKAYFSSESALQEYAVRQLYRIDKDIPIIANPHSSQRNVSTKQMSHKQRIAYFQKIKGNNRKQGFQEGQSDLIVCMGNGTWEHYGLAVELKTLEEDPFKPFRGKEGTLWVKETSDFEKSAHVHQQLDFLFRMQKQGYLALIAAGKEQWDAVYDYYFHDVPFLNSGFRTKRYEFMNKYFEKRLINYLSKI